MTSITQRGTTASAQRILVDRLNISMQGAWDWINRSQRSDDPTERELYARRVNAALTATREDYTEPAGGFREWLISVHRVRLEDVALWYGYSEATLASCIANGRFKAKRPKRAWTLVDYYLKESTRHA